MTSPIHVRSPAKINLHLRVAAQDASGFHPLRSWFVTTDLCDELSAAIGPSDEWRIGFRCDDVALPTDGRNLVVRAARAYLAAFDAIEPTARPFAIELSLTKRIPAGAGLGGGSSNAAATLHALDALLAPHFSRRPAPGRLAPSLGSDVPFFLGPPSAVATGRGERLVAAPRPSACFALLLFPPFGISTPTAFRRLDTLRPIAPASTLDAIDVDAWATLDARALSDKLVNDLEPAAFAIEPRLAGLRDDAERALDRPVRMSGSGSTLFAVFDSADDARRAALRINGVRSAVVTLGSASIEPFLSSTIF